MIKGPNAEIAARFSSKNRREFWVCEIFFIAIPLNCDLWLITKKIKKCNLDFNKQILCGS